MQSRNRFLNEYENYCIINRLLELNTEQRCLASFAAEVGAGPDKHVILVLDGAGWHVAKDLVVPEGVELMFLPPYSPQIQPAERLWPLTNEPIVNEYFETLEELDEVLAERCRILADDPDQIKAHTLFEWWPHHN